MIILSLSFCCTSIKNLVLDYTLTEWKVQAFRNFRFISYWNEDGKIPLSNTISLQ